MSFFTFPILKRKRTASPCSLHFISQGSSGSVGLTDYLVGFLLDAFIGSFIIDFGAPCKVLQKNILK